MDSMLDTGGSPTENGGIPGSPLRAVLGEFFPSRPLEKSGLLRGSRDIGWVFG